MIVIIYLLIIDVINYKDYVFLLICLIMNTYSGEVRDVSGRARAKLRMCVQRLNEPWSLKDMAKSWDRCAREAILDYAHSLGGGTFSSSTFGGAGWENC